MPLTPKLTAGFDRTDQEIIRLQAQHHGCVTTDRFRRAEDYVLYLIHLKAYEEAAQFVNESSYVLDLGCNTGYGTAVLAKSAREVIGVDVSVTALEEARRRFGSAENLSFTEVDGRTLPFEDGHFDVVVSMQVIEHIGDYDRYLSEIRRVSRPGGTAIFSTPNANLRLDDAMRPWNEFHVREFTPTDLRALLQGYFDHVDVRGLWGVEILEKVERARVGRARLSQRRQRRRSPVARLAHKRQQLRGRFRRLVSWRTDLDAVETKRSDVLASVQSYSPKDLWYSDSKPEDSLDLLAVCRN